MREGCLLEEEASGAHCVGLKQTILFPFVTLGSLINFCDCLMAGGTEPRQTTARWAAPTSTSTTRPTATRCTPSLFGDVPRGVMLDQPPIFLGGQGGAVGPVRVGFGTVVAAGCILREDILEDGSAWWSSGRTGRPSGATSRATYGNLAADRAQQRRLPGQPGGARALVSGGAAAVLRRAGVRRAGLRGRLEMLAGAKDERVKRLKAMAAKVPDAQPLHRGAAGESRRPGRPVPGRCRAGCGADRRGRRGREAFLSGFGEATAGETSYINAIKSLTPALSGQGVEWLQQTVDDLCARADALLPSLGICSPGKR